VSSPQTPKPQNPKSPIPNPQMFNKIELSIIKIIINNKNRI